MCRVEECPRDRLKAFDVDGGLRVLVATSGRDVYAYQAWCPHMEVALEEGFYDGVLYLASSPAAGDRSSSKET